MIEIIGLLLTIFSLIVFANFPLNFFIFKKKINLLKFSYSETLLLNVIINFNLLLFLSFFKINFNFLFIILISTSLFLICLNLKNFINLFNKNIYFSLFFLVLLYSISIVITKNAYLDWDGLHWIFKAQVFFQGGEYSNLKGVPIDYYPHLGPYIWSFFWKNSLLKYEYCGRIFYIFIFLICIFCLAQKLSKKFLFGEKIIIIFILCFLSTNFFLLGGYQEYLIFFSLFCFSYFFLHLLNSNKFIPNQYLIILILLLISNLLLWTKQEGFFYFIIVNFIFLIHSKQKYLSRLFHFIASLILMLFFVYVKYYYFDAFKFGEDIINNELIKNLNPFYLFSKITIISKYFLISFLKYPIWLLILLSLLILTFKYNFFKKNKFIYTYIFISFAFVYLIFLQTASDLSWVLPLTLNRVVFGISGFLVFIIIILLNKLKN